MGRAKKRAGPARVRSQSVKPQRAPEGFRTSVLMLLLAASTILLSTYEYVRVPFFAISAFFGLAIVSAMLIVNKRNIREQTQDKTNLERIQQSAGSGQNLKKTARYVADGGDTIVLIDVNNVRGTPMEFEHSLTHFLDLLAQWTRTTKLQGRVFAIVDHGMAPCSLVFGPLVVVFAGSDQTADDVIVEDSRGFTSAKPNHSKEPSDDFLSDEVVLPRKVAVITNDRGLRKRVLSVSRRGQAKVFSSGSLRSALDKISLEIASGRPIPRCLDPVKFTEQRMREAQQRSIELGIYQGETTWQRVLCAELMRRCMRMKGATHHALSWNRSSGAKGCATFLQSGLAVHLSKSLGPHYDSDLVISDLDQEMAELYCGDQLNTSQACRSILLDHRIRNDLTQKTYLCDYVRTSKIGIRGKTPTAHSEVCQNPQEDSGGLKPIEDRLGVPELVDDRSEFDFEAWFDSQVNRPAA